MTPEWAVVWATLALVAVTLGLAVYTALLYRATVKLGKGADDAAKKQADIAETQIALEAKQTDLAEKQHGLQRLQFLATHRPRVILREAYAVRDNGQPLKASYVLANTGGSDATIHESKFQLRHEPVTSIRRVPDCNNSMDIPTCTISLGAHLAGDHVSSEVGELWGMPFEIQTGGWAIYFSGHIVYEDANGILRHLAFYRVLNEETGRFVPINDPQLEYGDERP
jgi:hypothetical protein